MASTAGIESLNRDELLTLVRQQQGQIAELTALVESLRAELERSTRDGHRQAAPFSKGTRLAHPKKPGRKPGVGPFRYRTPPAPETITEPTVDVPLADRTCPDCGGALVPQRFDSAYVTELPEATRPRVTHYRVAAARCVACGKRLRGRHPAVAPDQAGATAHRLGPRLWAAVHLLHYGLGVPARKVPALLWSLTGVELTQGAITQDALRRAGRSVGLAYRRLRAELKEAKAIHTDDTGWRVGGDPAWLMAFETADATVYQVRPRHRNDEVRELVPSDFAGVLCTDRGKSYDAIELARVEQQKCLAHIQRSLSEVLQAKSGKARWFAAHLKALLSRAVSLWHDHRAGKAGDFAGRADAVRGAITHHLRDRPLSDRDNQRLLDELGTHHDRGNLLRFLSDPKLEPTNNRAERALRPAVIGRKVSQCSKTWGGAEAYAAFTSVIRTLAKTHGTALIDALVRLIQPPRPQTV